MGTPSTDVLLAVLQSQLSRLQQAAGDGVLVTIHFPDHEWQSLADLIEVDDWAIGQRLHCCQRVFKALVSTGSHRTILLLTCRLEQPAFKWLLLAKF